MNLFFPLAERVILNRVLSKKAPFTRSSKFGLGFLVLSGLLLLVALVFGILAGYGWLLVYFSQPFAALILAASTLCISAIVGVGGYLLLKHKPKTSTEDGDVTQIISDVISLIDEEWAEPVQENPKTAILLAGLAGFIASDRLN